MMQTIMTESEIGKGSWFICGQVRVALFSMITNIELIKAHDVPPQFTWQKTCAIVIILSKRLMVCNGWACWP